MIEHSVKANVNNKLNIKYYYCPKCRKMLHIKATSWRGSSEIKVVTNDGESNPILNSYNPPQINITLTVNCPTVECNKQKLIPIDKGMVPIVNKLINKGYHIGYTSGGYYVNMDTISYWTDGSPYNESGIPKFFINLGDKYDEFITKLDRRIAYFNSNEKHRVVTSYGSHLIKMTPYPTIKMVQITVDNEVKSKNWRYIKDKDLFDLIRLGSLKLMNDFVYELPRVWDL